MTKVKSSWEDVNKWYHGQVGEEGHYYHKQLILPALLPYLSGDGELSLLDLGCGQGILARAIPSTFQYAGIDASASLIQAAKSLNKKSTHQFIFADATKKLPLAKRDFSHAAIILALQNMEHQDKAIENAAGHLRSGGKLLIVLNHPCYRIPRQSSWGVDEQKKMQYRRIEKYMSPMKIPIQMHPGKKEKSEETWSFHHPLGDYTLWLKKAGMVIEEIQELCSDKESTGKAAKMENRSREEFPLFLLISAIKLPLTK